MRTIRIRTKAKAVLKAIDKVIEQGGACQYGGSCVYQNTSGMKCIVGHMINLKADREWLDREYSGQGVLNYIHELEADRNEYEFVDEDGKLVSIEHLRLLERLQGVHDGESAGAELDLEHWRGRFLDECGDWVLS